MSGSSIDSPEGRSWRTHFCVMPLSYGHRLFSVDRKRQGATGGPPVDIFEDEQAKPPILPEHKAPVINSFITVQSKLGGITHCAASALMPTLGAIRPRLVSRKSRHGDGVNPSVETKRISTLSVRPGFGRFPAGPDPSSD
jgi:hypothetical protein